MKVKVITRNPSDYLRETKLDIHKAPRNYDPKLHPFEVPREYQRALNAVKLDKIFAKPFLGSLDGHSDVVECLLKHPTSLTHLISSSTDGEIKFWNVANRTCLRTIDAHNGMISSLCASHEGDYFYSVGDQTIKQWRFVRSWTGKLAKNYLIKASTSKANADDQEESDSDEEEKDDDDESDDDDDDMIADNESEKDTYGVPVNTIISKSSFINCIDHHWKKPILITSGDNVEVWEIGRTEPLQSLRWGMDSVHKIKFNPVETDVCISAASDRSIILYDIRQSNPLRKVTLDMKSNSISWNPMEAYHFTAANEDTNLYTFDMRRLKYPLLIHKDHTNAVIDIDYAPTGKEFVSGSYDKTLRIFPVDKSKSREVYHTKRMQRITSVAWSLDNKYIFSGSDEMDIRIWKAFASEKLAPSMAREEAALRYRDSLKKKFAFHPEINKIARHRHVPKRILHERMQKKLMIDAKKKREANRRLHSKPGTYPEVREKEEMVVKEQE